MAINSFTTCKQRLVAPHQPIRFHKVSFGARANKLVSTWTQASNAGVAPTTAVVPTSATTGALGQSNPVTANQLRIMGVEVGGDQTTPLGTMMICDRLSHQAGLDGTVATAQTTNLPTAALTRYTSGVGVLGVLEIYSALGVTPTTFTVSYTNQSGTSGRTSPAADIGNTDFRESNLMLPIPLQQGDTGIRSVESVTLAGSTGTAGNFGVTLYKPLLTLPGMLIRGAYDFDLLNMLWQLEPIINDACLYIVHFSPGNNTNAISGTFYIAED